MNYDPDQFIDLMGRVEADGDTHLDQVCRHRRYTFTGEHEKPLIYPGCGNSSLFEISYDLESHGDLVERGKHVVCAVDDAMGAWPRYGAMAHDATNGGWIPDGEDGAFLR